jgi:hypothetical protein
LFAAGAVSSEELGQIKGEAAVAEVELRAAVEAREAAGKQSREEATKPPAATQSQKRPAFGPVVERVLPLGVPCREQYFQFRSGQVFVIGNGPGTSATEAAIDERRIDEAGGVDFSVSTGDDTVQLIGRGCFFTREAHDLKWASTTADQVVHAIRRAGEIHGVIEPRKSELPITYLFKTARGETGIIEVIGPAPLGSEGEQSKTLGVKFRYKLVEGSGTPPEPPAALASPLVFGPEAGGLAAALEVTPAEPFRIRIHIRNVSDSPISIGGAAYRQEDDCLLSDSEGRVVPVTRVTHDIPMGMKGGYFAPGQVAVFESAGLSFLSAAALEKSTLIEKTVEPASAAAGYLAPFKPGRYALRMRVRLPGDDVPFNPGPNVWHGSLITGPATITLKTPGEYPPTAVADSTSSARLGPPVERTLADLTTTHKNCALNLETGKLVSVPEEFTLDTFAGPSMDRVPTDLNATDKSKVDKAIAWAKANEVDVVAFVTKREGKVVKCGLYGPGLIVLRANNKEWDPNTASPRDLKEAFDEAMSSWGFIPQIADLSCEADFPADLAGAVLSGRASETSNFMILDTRTHRRGILTITGVTDDRKGVKIRYRLVEGAPVKKITPP